MSATRLPRQLAGKVFGGAAHAVRHPIGTLAYGAGIARGAATIVRRLAGVADEQESPVAQPSGSGQASGEPASGPQVVGLAPGERHAAEMADAVTPTDPRPGRPGEQFETDPQASSRDSEHGGPGVDDELDVLEDWPQDPGADTSQAARAESPDVTTPVGTTGAGEGFNPDTDDTGLQQPDTEPLMDPSLTKQVKSEADMMAKDAEPDADDKE